MPRAIPGPPSEGLSVKVSLPLVGLTAAFLVFGSACDAAPSKPVQSTPIDSTVAIVTGGAVPPVVTVGTLTQRNAIRKAENYLSTMPFSKSGLVKQLVFEEYTKVDAEFAVEHITVNWDEQADKKAESYMSIMPYNKNSLIKQLKFEGFTVAQATHGAASVGLG